MALLTPSVDVRRAGDRFATDIGWLDSKHSFSFGHHYDARNTHFGLLLVNNDDVVAPGSGFETHPHRDMEIVTWVLRRPAGAPGLAGPQRPDLPGAGPADERRHRHPALGEERQLAADRRRRAHGPGALRADVGAAGRERHPARLRAARHRRRAAARRPGAGRERPAASTRTRPRSRSASGTRRCSPRGWRRAASVAVPDAPFVHVYVGRRRGRARGRRPAGHRRRRPDHRRRRPAGDRRPDGAEVLVWEMHAALWPPDRIAVTRPDPAAAYAAHG